jgi:hypothetical protein
VLRKFFQFFIIQNFGLIDSKLVIYVEDWPHEVEDWNNCSQSEWLLFKFQLGWLVRLRAEGWLMPWHYFVINFVGTQSVLNARDRAEKIA